VEEEVEDERAREAVEKLRHPHFLRFLPLLLPFRFGVGGGDDDHQVKQPHPGGVGEGREIEKEREGGRERR